MDANLNKHAGVLDIVWDSKKGKFENALRLVGIGGMLGLGGNLGILLGVTKFLGFDISILGKYLDEALGNRNISDVNPEELGNIAANKLWSEVENSVTASKYSSFSKFAGEAELDAIYEQELKSATESQNAKNPKKVINIQKSPQREKALDRQHRSEEKAKDRALREQLSREEAENKRQQAEKEWARQDQADDAKRKHELDKEKLRLEHERQKIEDERKFKQDEEQKKLNLSKEESSAKFERDRLEHERRRTESLADEDTKRNLRKEDQAAEHARMTVIEKQKREFALAEEKRRHRNAMELARVRGKPSLSGLKSVGGKFGLAAALAGVVALVASQFANKSSDLNNAIVQDRTKQEVVEPTNTNTKSNNQLDSVVKQILNYQ